VATVGRPIGWGRVLAVLGLAGAALWATMHVHQGSHAAAAADRVLVGPVLQPVCAPWIELAGRPSRTRSEVAAEASASRAAFEQANQIDPGARLGNAVSAAVFLDALQEPSGAGATDDEVDRAVATLGDACRSYR
jgi:hypothetical protein